MWNDPIIEEVHQARYLIEKECEFNSEKIFERAKKLEQKYKKKLVSRIPQPEIRRKMVVSAYSAGEISLGKAAEIMGVSSEEMKKILSERGAELHFGPRTIHELYQDIGNA
jgi:predicted HTH domain antitoxin